MNKLIFIFIHSRGIPMNIIVEDNKQIQLFVACSPNAGALKILNNKEKINISLNIPRIIAITNIIISLEIVK